MPELELGRSLRDEGAQLALKNAGDEWRTTATTLVLKYFNIVGDGLFEDAREYAVSCGITAPPSPNSWGAVALSLSKKRLITKTGVLLPSKTTKSHARSQPVWRLTDRMPDGEREQTHPPSQREWKDLTTAEIKALWNATKKPSEFAELLLAKVKEKNNRDMPGV